MYEIVMVTLSVSFYAMLIKKLQCSDITCAIPYYKVFLPAWLGILIYIGQLSNRQIHFIKNANL